MEWKSDIDVELIQRVGDDFSIAHAAWVSTGANIGQAVDEERVRGIIRFLMKNRHGTPFEHGSMTVRVHAPIKVWREWHRHRIGWCLAGDTDLWTESYAPKSGRTLRKRRLKDLHDCWNHGVQDSLGRIRFLPSVRQQRLRVLNEDTGFFELGSINNVVQSGVKECLLLESSHKKGWSLRCSKDHQILTSEGWVRAGDLIGSELVAVVGKKNLFERTVPPSLRAGIGVWTSMQRKILIPENGCDCYICKKPFHFESLVLDHVVPVAKDIKLALDQENLKPACLTCHRAKTNSEQSLSRRGLGAGVSFVPLLRKPYLISEEMTYDVEMQGPWHNFVANGIVVHNSYNEESGRYKQLEPIFYIPPRERPSIRPDGFKSSRPAFDVATDEEYAAMCSELKAGYTESYARYERLLAMQVDRGLARDVLGVGIYSACWCTANPRSIMAFLELRTEHNEAKRPSHPLYEINVAANKLEALFAQRWPITYEAFVENGRMAP